MGADPAARGLHVQPEIAGAEIEPRTILGPPCAKHACWSAATPNQEEFAKEAVDGSCGWVLEALEDRSKPIEANRFTACATALRIGWGPRIRRMVSPIERKYRMSSGSRERQRMTVKLPSLTLSTALMSDCTSNCTSKLSSRIGAGCRLSRSPTATRMHARSWLSLPTKEPGYIRSGATE